MTRLGEVLLESGAISPPALNRALEIQRATGGRLGTVLLEHGLVTEETLSRALARLTGHDYAPWPSVKSAAPDVFQILPAKVAVRYGAVPFARDGRSLRVAMRDPGDLAAEDEISFVTGRKVASYVLTESRVAEALERFYGERRSARFRLLSERLDRAGAASLPQPPPPPPDFFTPGGRASRAPSRSGGPRISDVLRVAAPDGEIEISTWTPHAGAVAAPAPPAEIEFTLPEEPAPPPAPAAPLTMERARERMLSADSREDIAEAALDFLAPEYPLAALFIARKEDVIGWGIRGANASRSGLKSLRIPFSEPSLFLNVRLSGLLYQGRFPDLPAHERLVTALGHRPERWVLAPVSLRRRVVAFLGVEPAALPLPADESRRLQALAASMADAFGRLILAQRRGKAEDNP